MNREVILGDFGPHDIFLRSRWIMITPRQSIYFSDAEGISLLASSFEKDRTS